MKTYTIDQNGKKTEKSIDLSDAIFAGKVNSTLLAQSVYVYLSNQRQSNAKAKDRSEVSGGGKKPWKQKGTGRARVGSSRSPIWKGGGASFGPTNEKNYKKIMNRKARISSFRSAFSKLMNENMISFVEGFELDSKKMTSKASDFKKALGAKKLLVITATKNDQVINAFSNLRNSEVRLVTELSVYDLLTKGNIVLLTDSLEYINTKWGEEKVATK